MSVDAIMSCLQANQVGEALDLTLLNWNSQTQLAEAVLSTPETRTHFVSILLAMAQTPHWTQRQEEESLRLAIQSCDTFPWETLEYLYDERPYMQEFIRAAIRDMSPKPMPLSAFMDKVSFISRPEHLLELLLLHSHPHTDPADCKTIAAGLGALFKPADLARSLVIMTHLLATHPTPCACIEEIAKFSC